MKIKVVLAATVEDFWNYIRSSLGDKLTYTNKGQVEAKDSEGNEYYYARDAEGLRGLQHYDLIETPAGSKHKKADAIRQMHRYSK